ncbi:MAG: tRNA pseudouridine synthase [Segetibacter sp.]|nr:tRNA pseudouridine synthase [Segetibacter sp.]
MRYFLEVSYKGTNYAGFQIQLNANTVQGELEKALQIVTRANIALTGSSRTDAGVHAMQNFFHFDLAIDFKPGSIYNVNALLPRDIVVKSIFPVAPDAHARFLAVSREYKYFITTTKDPFSIDTSWYYPFSVDTNLLNQAAEMLYRYSDYTSFSKRNTQVFTHQCTILKSEWVLQNNSLVYNVKANRFLRGMVRGMVGTMLLVGRKKISLGDFENIIQLKDCTNANFATPAHGLFLCKVEYPASLFK